VNGKVYFSKKKGIQALNLSDGQLLWESQLGDDLLINVVKGVIYGVSFSRYVYALDASNGFLLWKHKVLRQDIDVHSLTSPYVVDQVIYITCSNIYALNAKDGSQLWRLDGTAGDLSLFIPTNGSIFVYTPFDKQIDEISTKDGSVRQPFRVEGSISDSQVANGILYAITSTAQATSSGDVYLYALDTNDGKLLRKQDLGKAIQLSPTATSTASQ